MMGDLATVVWKEWKEQLAQGGSRRSTAVNWLIVAGILGVLLPFSQGTNWLRFGIGASLWPMIFTVNALIADAVAGERERHTLDTLLATRLPDRAILCGKVIAALLFTWWLIALIVVAGTITVNLRALGTGLHLPSLLGLATVLLMVPLTTFMAGVGILVSMRSTTVRHAQQVLTIGFFVFGALAVAVIYFAGRLPSSWRHAIADALRDASPVALVTGAVLIALLVVAIPYALAIHWFTRPRLTLLGGK
jgi:ABC-2 type transport system permease protein